MINHIRTVFLLTGLTVLIVWLGGVFGGREGMIMALLLAVGMNFFSYWYSDRIILKMYRAEEITPDQSPDLYAIVEELADRAGLPMPRVYRIPNDSPNAFATGRNPDHAVVAVTDGLIQRMNFEEIRGVLAHEIAHVKNRDILIGSIAAVLAGAIMVMSSMARWSAVFGGREEDEGGGHSGLALLIVSFLAPIAALLIQMAISRSREYLADESAAVFAGNGLGLANALEKISMSSGRLPMQATPSTAHMFIVNPLRAGGIMSLFSTHPPLEERIARLRGAGPSRTSGNRDGRLEDEGRAFWDRLSG